MKHTNCKRALSFLLAMLMLAAFFSGPSGIGAVAVSEKGEENIQTLLTAEQLKAFKEIDRTQRAGGLIGFSDILNSTKRDSTKKDGDELVSVIVEFIHQPPKVQQVTAMMEGKRLLSGDAEQLAQSDHDKFREALNGMFKADANERAAQEKYKITSEYKDALNGVAVKLPESKLEELSKLDMVWAVYPNLEVQLDPNELKSEALVDYDEAGMADTRDYLDIDYIREIMGLTGEGITVGVLDTGVDYHHPDIAHAFSSTYNGTGDLEPIDGIYYGRNFINYEEVELDELAWRSPYDPMETTYAEWSATSYEKYSGTSEFYTAHGTHVSGTIVAGGANDNMAALGMAPNATLLSYRVLGPYGSGVTEWILAGMDKVYEDGCDIINMSLGATTNNPAYITSVAANNLVVAHNMVVIIAAGNSGSSAETMSSPATSSLSVTVGNGTVGSVERTLKATSGAGGFEMNFLTSDFSDISSNGDGTWSFTPDSGINLNAAQLVPIEAVDTQGEFFAGANIGFGSEAEFQAAGDLTGKIAVVYRGQPFTTTSTIAKRYGAMAVIVVTNGGILHGFQGQSVTYAPVFLTITQDEAIAAIEDALNNGGTLSFAAPDYREAQLTGGELNSSSSRGPVGGTQDIKPDVVAPGTNVLSCVPFFITADDKLDFQTQGAYDSAYAHYSGTSMASPHVAGIAALMMQYSRDNALNWNAQEIKARMMNTAGAMEDYSVHEVGAGYIRPLKALNTDTYVLVDYDKVLLHDDSPSGVKEAQGQLSSLNFGVWASEQDKAQSVTLSASVYNDSGTAKTFDLSYSKNHTGFTQSGETHRLATQQMWSDIGANITFSSSSVNVSAGQQAPFEVSINVDANITQEYIGLYEGYVSLTNRDDTSEAYILPFSLCIGSNNFFELAFINQPVITTSGLAISSNGLEYYPDLVHLKRSLYADLNVTLNQAVDALHFIVTEADCEDPEDEGKWIGEAADSIYGSQLTVGTPHHFSELFSPIYMKFADGKRDEYELAIYEPGMYRMYIKADTNMGVQYYDLGSFAVDNTVPELTIENEKAEDIVTYEGDVRATTVTGNIYDEGLGQMKEAGILYSIYDSPSDYHGPQVDQALNALFAQIKGESKYVKAEIEPNGDFTLPLEGLNSSGETQITIYYFDAFSAAQFPQDTPMSSGFDLERPCMSSFYGAPYAFYGINKGVKSIKLTHTGPNIQLTPGYATLEIGESLSLQSKLNEQALQAGFKNISLTSSDDSIVTISADGKLTALKYGTVTITASSANAGEETLIATCKVVVIGAGDGVEIPDGSALFFGAGEYEDYNIDISNQSRPFDGSAGAYIDESTGQTTIPYSWTVMGEEKQNGRGDGYLTLLSDKAIKNADYNAAGYVPYAGSDINKYLNGGFIADNFSASEQDIIAKFDVTTGGRTANEQRMYLPWGVKSGISEDYSGMVFWTAGEEKAAGAALMGDEYKNHLRYRNESLLLYSTYYLRNGEDASNQVQAVNGETGKIVTSSSWEQYGRGYNYNAYGNYEGMEIGYGVRPATKLDMNSVVYAYPYPFDPDTSTVIVTDAHGYLYGRDEDMHLYTTANTGYKLSVLSDSVGALENISQQDARIEEGEKISLNSVTSEQYGEDYIIAYKIVGDENETRKIFKYGEVKTSDLAQDITLYTNQLSAGKYKVYMWLQKYSGLNSYEAGDITKFNLEISPVRTQDVSAGVSLNAGDYVYYGSYSHATQVDEDEYDARASSWEAVQTPVLWEIMGEEIDKNGNGDGYHTLLSRYVLDTIPFSENSESSMWFSLSAEYENATAQLWLNRKFSNGFSKGEYNAMPFVTVERTDYDVDDAVYIGHTKSITAPNQKLYLPWGTKYTMDDTQGFFTSTGRSVFWSAGEDTSISENALAYKYDESVDDLSGVQSTLKSGEQASYWLGAATAERIGYVYGSGKFYQGGIMTDFVNPQRNGGVRPAAKLMPEHIVYAAKVGEDIPADGTNYLQPKNGDAYYKLTVLGGRAGEDVGTLAGLPESVYAPYKSDLSIDSIVPSENGENYKVAYKIVSKKTGEEVIVSYGEMNTKPGAQAISLNTAELDLGEYTLFVWLQKGNDNSSHEAGVVYQLPLTVTDDIIVQYLPNGGTGGKSVAVSKGALHRVLKAQDAQILRDGYAFSHWSTQADGKGISYKPGDEIKAEENLTLHAQWKLSMHGVEQWLHTQDHISYVKGYPDGTFGTDRSMTRAEAAVMFYNLLLDKNATSSRVFRDVPIDSWYGPAVYALTAAGVINGYEDGSFRPGGIITRAEMVKIATAFADEEIKGEASFPDVMSHAWYYDYVQKSVAYKWIVGYQDGTFKPARSITRAEVVTIVNRMLMRAADTDFIDKNQSKIKTFPDLKKSHWAYYQIIEAANTHTYSNPQGEEEWEGLNS